MRVRLVRPSSSGDSDYRARSGLGLRVARGIFNAVSPIRVGAGSEVPPLGLMMLAALTPPQHEVEIYDEEVQAVPVDDQPDLVGLSLLTRTAERGYELADEFRRLGVRVVLGGIHATVMPEEAAAHADAVVIGEGEPVWRDLLEDACRGRLAPVYDGGAGADLSTLPAPRRTALTSDRYVTTNLVQATRGCPNRCSFCSIHIISGDRYRCRPVEQVIAELAEFDDPAVIFVDDNIVGDPVNAKRLFREMIPLKKKWWGQASLRIADDEELLDLAARSGASMLLIGFESLCDENLAAVGKSHTNRAADFGRALDRIHEYGICVIGSFIFGLDHDDAGVFERTAEFAAHNHLDICQLSMLTPLPGTKLFEEMDAEGRILHRRWSEYGKRLGRPVFEPCLMTGEQLDEGYRWMLGRLLTPSAIAQRLLPVHRNSLPALVYNLLQRRLLSAAEIPARVRATADSRP